MMLRALSVILFFALSPAAFSQSTEEPEPAVQAPAGQGGAVRAETGVDAPIINPDDPLYSPFTARYLLDEVHRMRSDLERTRADLIEKQVQREYQIADRATAQAQRAIEVFFYTIAGVTTLGVFIGWSSLRDVKERVNQIAESKVSELIDGYAQRLDQIETELKVKSARLKEAQREIDLTNEVHSLWLRATQEATPAGKISVYDEIIRLRPDDVEALTYKADAALALNESQWALSLCNRALDREPDNAHAFYQRACAYAATGFIEEAMSDLRDAIQRSESLRVEARNDEAFDALRAMQEFQALTEVAIAAE